MFALSCRLMPRPAEEKTRTSSRRREGGEWFHTRQMPRAARRELVAKCRNGPAHVVRGSVCPEMMGEARAENMQRCARRPGRRPCRRHACGVQSAACSVPVPCARSGPLIHERVYARECLPAFTQPSRCYTLYFLLVYCLRVLPPAACHAHVDDACRAVPMPPSSSIRYATASPSQEARYARRARADEQRGGDM